MKNFQPFSILILILLFSCRQDPTSHPEPRETDSVSKTVWFLQNMEDEGELLFNGELVDSFKSASILVERDSFIFSSNGAFNMNIKGRKERNFSQSTPVEYFNLDIHGSYIKTDSTFLFDIDDRSPFHVDSKFEIIEETDGLLKLRTSYRMPRGSNSDGVYAELGLLYLTFNK